MSLALGMIPVVSDRFFSQLPEVLSKFFHNGILLGTLTAVLVNFALNHRETGEAAEAAGAAESAGPVSDRPGSGAATGCR